MFSGPSPDSPKGKLTAFLMVSPKRRQPPPTAMGRGTHLSSFEWEAALALSLVALRPAHLPPSLQSHWEAPRTWLYRMDPGNSVQGGLLGLTLGGADPSSSVPRAGALAPRPMKHEELTLRPSHVPGSTWVPAASSSLSS